MEDVSKIRKIYCPNCGKSLISLEPIKENVNTFWCDECEIDIEIKNNENVEDEKKVEPSKKYKTFDEVLADEHIGFGDVDERVTIGYINPLNNEKEENVTFIVDNANQLLVYFRNYLEDKYGSTDAANKVTFMDVNITEERMCDRLRIDTTFNNLIKSLLADEYNNTSVKSKVLTDDFENNILDKIKETLTNVGVNVPLYYPRLVNDNKAYEDSEGFDYASDFVYCDESFLPIDGEKF